MRGELDAARAELARLRAIANAADSRVSIERTAQQTLAQQVRALEQENARVREELAMFEQMLVSEERHTQTLAIYRFKVEPDVLPGEYRYRLLLLTPTDRPRPRLQRPPRAGGQPAGRGPECYDVASRSRAMPQPLNSRLAFKYFQRVEGTFRVNPKAKVESVQVRVYRGRLEPAARHALGQPGWHAK